MYGQNIDGKRPDLTRSKANMKAIAFCRRKLRGLIREDTHDLHFEVEVGDKTKMRCYRMLGVWGL